MIVRPTCVWVVLSGFAMAACSLVPDLAAPPPTGLTEASPLPTSSTAPILDPTLAGSALAACDPSDCLIPSPDPAGPAPTQDAFFRRRVLLPVAEAILELANTERQALGLTALSPSSSLMDLAFNRSEDMVARSYFAHSDPLDGHLVAESLLIGGGYGGRLGENLFSYSGPLGDLALDALASWMSGPDERSLILDPAFQMTGVGVMGDGSWWTVTQLFAETGPVETCGCEQP